MIRLADQSAIAKFISTWNYFGHLEILKQAMFFPPSTAPCVLLFRQSETTSVQTIYG